VAHPLFLFCLLFFIFNLKNGGKKKTPEPLMPLPPSQPQVVFSFRHAYFSQSTFLQRKRRAKQDKSFGFLFVFLKKKKKKQDACHVDKLAPSCLPWRDFNDLSNLVRNANTIKLVVIV
jgi:hypothetical protein